jgi:hypothetical protein
VLLIEEIELLHVDLWHVRSEAAEALEEEPPPPEHARVTGALQARLRAIARRQQRASPEG